MRSSGAVALAVWPASYSFDVSCLEVVPNLDPPIQMRDATQSAQGTYLVSPRPHAFGETGRHLLRVSRKVDWPTGGDID